MKSIMSLLVLLLLSANAFASVIDKMANTTEPYKVLKEAYTSAPRAAGAADVSWMNEFKQTWESCAIYDEKNIPDDSNIIVGKWYHKKTITPAIPANPGNGPLIPGTPEVPATYSSRVILDLIFYHGNYFFTDTTPFTDDYMSNIVHGKNEKENAYSIKTPSYSGKVLAGYGVNLIKTDGKYLLIKSATENLNGVESSTVYGYCWKK